jgi:hypothetical protein
MTSAVHSPTSANTPLYECHTVAFGRPTYVGLTGGPDALDAARARLAELDAMWGPGGDIDRINARPGMMTRVSADTVLLAVLATEPVARRRRVRPPESGLRVDVRHSAVGLLSDTPVDLGQLAAALAVDLVLSDLVDADLVDGDLVDGDLVDGDLVDADPVDADPVEGDLVDARGAGIRLAGACVRIGRTARALGSPPRGGDWLVDVDGGRRPLRRAAISCARSDRGASVLVVADQAWRAHLLGTTALTLPPERAGAFLRDTASAARLTAPDGTVQAVGGWNHR